MRVLIFHGYLLRGTGSNIYNASVASALARLGHEVHLFSQDRGAGDLPWVDRVGRWEDGELRIVCAGGGEGPGSVTVYLPDIGGVLPVYVVDEYEGLHAKAFPDLTDVELDAYLASNVAAVRDVVAGAGGVDAALANHLIMGPAILARAGLRFAAKIHGSALEYTVKPHAKRFVPYAREGTDAASGVLVGSAHTAASLWRALDDPTLPPKTRLGPPGVDTSLFAPIARDEREPRLRALAADLRAAPDGDSNWDRDPEEAAGALEEFADADGARVVFIGKLIVSKGVDLLLAAWPVVHAANPGARLLMVGFGEYDEASRRLWAALQTGDLETVREMARRGRALEGGEEAPLEMLEAFLDDLPPGYADSAEAAAGSVSFSGRLEHEEVGRLVPAADVLVMPSTFPESFGMVAAEAAAAGTPPVSAAHSGMAEVSQALAEGLPPEASGLVSFELGDCAVASLAACISGWLGLDADARARALTALHEVASDRWSWDGVARGVLAASAGELDGLPAPHVPAATSSDAAVFGGGPEQ